MAGGDEHVQIFVKVLTGKSIALDVETGDNLDTVMAKLQEATGTKVERPRLIFCGKVLEGHRPLSEYGIKKESTLHLVGTLCGGAKDRIAHEDATTAAKLAEDERRRLMNAHNEIYGGVPERKVFIGTQSDVDRAIIFEQQMAMLRDVRYNTEVYAGRHCDVWRQPCGAALFGSCCYPCAILRLARWCTGRDPMYCQCGQRQHRIPGVERCAGHPYPTCITDQRGYEHDSYAHTGQLYGNGFTRRTLDIMTLLLGPTLPILCVVALVKQGGVHVSSTALPTLVKSLTMD